MVCLLSPVKALTLDLSCSNCTWRLDTSIKSSSFTFCSLSILTNSLAMSCTENMYIIVNNNLIETKLYILQINYENIKHNVSLQANKWYWSDGNGLPISNFTRHVYRGLFWNYRQQWQWTGSRMHFILLTLSNLYFFRKLKNYVCSNAYSLMGHKYSKFNSKSFELAHLLCTDKWRVTYTSHWYQI